MIKTIQKLTASALISSSLILAGCSESQQDSLFESTISFARDSVGLDVKSVQAGDVKLTYMERLAEENSESIVLLHGFSADKDNWIRFTHALDEKYHVIAVDLAGHGDSEQALSTDYNLILQAERLNTLIEEIGIESFHIAGNSMGGAISAIYSLNYPDKVKSLTLIDAAGIDGETPSEYFQALAQGNNPLIATDEKSFNFRMDFTMSQPPLLPWPLKTALLRKTLAREAINKKIFSDILATKEALEANNFHQQIEARIAEKKLPTMIMWGKEDRVLDVSAAHAFKQLIPHAHLHIFEDVGHLPMVEIPNESAEVYQQFLANLD
jgi:pimeloyl-ACP methyl ester carboxylesterase